MFQKHMGHEAPEQHTAIEIHHPMGHGLLDQKRDKAGRSPYAAQLQNMGATQAQAPQLPQGSAGQTPDQDDSMGGSY
jgi:hypothetical protein